MAVFMFIIVSFCIGQCYGQKTQRKLARLQQDVEFLRDLALDLRFDIQGIQEWRNATVASPSNAGAIDTDNEVVEDSRLLRSFEQSLDVMETKVNYIIKGLGGEKMALREMVEDIRSEVRHEMAMIKIGVNSAVNEINDTRVVAANNKDALRDVFSNITSRLEMVEARITAEMEEGETKRKEEKREMEEAIRQIDVKLVQQILTTRSRDAENNKQFTRISNQLESSGKNCGDAFALIKDMSTRLEATTKAYGEIMEQVNHISEQLDTARNMALANLKRGGWLQYINYVYKRFKPKVNFSAAVKGCEDQDASLVEVTDPGELQFLVDNFGTDGSWLGATDLQTGGEWRWLSGQLVKDGSWGQGQPNGQGEHCLLYNSAYHDYPCESLHAYVCKIPIPLFI